jgi:uncharacterized repeat protein (TIGR03837 family)
MATSCDLFCSVVDNLGDAGVCWRLARQLAAEHRWQVRLWIDDLRPLSGLRPGIDPDQDWQTIDGVDVRRWPAPFPAVEPADVVIEAFACDLPSAFVDAMAVRHRPPVWINLEYLSAEDWVTECHGLPSPHPTLPLTKHFFFPGFTPGTGGLIRESRLSCPRGRRAGEELAISLFCYDNAALPHLLECWRQGNERIRCRVAEGLPRRQMETWLGVAFPAGTTVHRGPLTLEAIPFLSQDEYDQWLAESDLNFVRGEDSFVRAQWATRPFVWHIYPQEAGAHLEKLDAFLARYTRHLPATVVTGVRTFWQAWNGCGDIAAAWPGLLAHLPALGDHGTRWAATLAKTGDLAGNLVRFCSKWL